MKKYIVTPDKHFPLQDKQSIALLCKVIEEVKPDGYIDLGDTGEWSSVSKWKWKNKAKPHLEYYLPEIITDVEDVNKGMDQIDEALDKANVNEKHFIQGNHELWLDYFVESAPYLPQYGCKEALKIDERGYNYYEAGLDKCLRIGDLSFYHGHNYGGLHHANAHCKNYKRSVMYGHFHDIQVFTDKGPDGPISAYSIGCLKSMDKKDNEFIGGRPMNWKQAFAIVTFSGKDHYVEIVEINKGKAIIDGNLFRI